MVELDALGTCALCKTPALLQQSHIIPAFTFRWLKAGSPGHIRHSADINKRVQDGATEKWLCSKCEALFSEWETKFCNKIFNPFCYGDALPSISYDDWLLKFCVSVSWRSLLYIREEAQFSEFNRKQVALVKNAADVWADFLLGKLKHPGKFEQHLIPLGPIRGIKDIQFPPNINRYLLR